MATFDQAERDVLDLKDEREFGGSISDASIARYNRDSVPLIRAVDELRILAPDNVVEEAQNALLMLDGWSDDFTTKEFKKQVRMADAAFFKFVDAAGTDLALTLSPQ